MSAKADGEIREVLESFISAFESGDLERMEAAFAKDAVTFPRSIMAAGIDEAVDISRYRRVRGLDPQMHEMIAEFQGSGQKPPYLNIEPRDLEIKVFDGAALATFHLENGEILGRRTFVLAKKGDDWKIVHLHASNVSGE